jgi:hypothetical protein
MLEATLVVLPGLWPPGGLKPGARIGLVRPLSGVGLAISLRHAVGGGGPRAFCA